MPGQSGSRSRSRSRTLVRKRDTFELEGCVELELLVVDGGGAVKAVLVPEGTRRDLVRDTAVVLVCWEDIAASSQDLLYGGEPKGKEIKLEQGRDSND